MQGAFTGAHFSSVPNNELSERLALKIHGYDFSDEDGSSDSGLSDFDEWHGLLKPPTLNINPDDVIVIQPKKSKINRKHPSLQQKQYNATKNNKLSRENERKIQNRFNVKVHNFYELLDESDKDSENENKYTEAADESSAKVSRRKKREQKQVKNETPLESDSGDCKTSNPDKYQNKFENKLNKIYAGDENFIADLNFFLIHLQWNSWSNGKIETQLTSWDNISRNYIYRSDKLLEQEYCDIVGSKMCTCCTGYEYRRNAALKNLIEVTGMPYVAYLAKNFWTVLDNDTFLSVVGILIATVIYARCR